MKTCFYCDKQAHIKRSKTGNFACKDCFVERFENEINEVINDKKLFQRDEVIAIGVSGGKDSSVLAYVLNKLNKTYNYGWNLVLIAVDEGIKGYRDDSLKSVHIIQQQLDLPLKVLSYKEQFNLSMDEIVEIIGKKHNCTYCGVFRRQTLEKAAKMMGAVKIATGHNADDTAETVIMNLLRGDISRLPKCVLPISMDGMTLPRCKPLIYTYQKEIVLYAKYLNLEYFATECHYSSYGYRSNARTLIKDLESVDPQSILNIIKSIECFKCTPDTKPQVLSNCEKCGSETSQKVCQACVLIESLNYQISNQQKLGLKSLKKSIQNPQ